MRKEQNSFFISREGKKSLPETFKSDWEILEPTSFHRLYRNIQFHVGLQEFNCLYNLSDRIVKFQFDNKSSLSLVLQLKSKNVIRRVLIYKRQTIPGQHAQNPQNSTSYYSIYTGFYSSNDIRQYIAFSPGEYLLVPNLGTQLRVYSREKVSFHSANGSREEEGQIKNEFSLMLQGFSQCQLKHIKYEFVRTCYFDLGIIVHTYLNMHDQQMTFQAFSEESEQDKKLMFETWYEENTRNVKLKKGQLMIEFYELTKRPALILKGNKKQYCAYFRISKNKEELKTKTIHLNIK